MRAQLRQNRISPISPKGATRRSAMPAAVSFIAGMCVAVALSSHVFASEERVMMLLFDRTGSMNAVETDPETGVKDTRFEHSWRYLKRDIAAQLVKDRENLKIFILPFSVDNGAGATRLPIGSDADLNAALEDLKRRFPPDGATDIARAMTQAIKDLSPLPFASGSQLQVTLYSDGEQNIWRPKTGKPTPQTEKEIEARCEEEVNDAVESLYQFFKDKNLLDRDHTSGFNVKYWGGKNPVKSAADKHPDMVKDGDNLNELLAKAKADLVAMENVQVNNAPDGSVEISGTWKAAFEKVSSAKIEIRPGAPYDVEANIYKETVGDTANKKEGPFKLKLSNAQANPKENITIRGKISEAAPSNPKAKIEIGSGCVINTYIGSDARIWFAYPSDGTLPEVFSHTTINIPVEGIFKLRWNSAAANIPIKLSYPESALSPSVSTSDGKVLKEGEFKLGDLFGSAQSAAFRIKILPAQSTSKSNTVSLVEFASPAFPKGTLMAVLGVFPPAIHFDGIDLNEFRYDADETSTTLNVLSIKPDASTGERPVALDVINQHAERMTAQLLVNGKPLMEKKFNLKEPATVAIKLTGLQRDYLKDFKPGEILVDCAVADSGAKAEFGFGFSPEKPGQYPLKVKFIDKPRFIAVLYGPDGKPAVPGQSTPTMQVGERVQFTLKCNWNLSAVGKKVAHPFMAPLDLGVVKAEVDPAMLDWKLDDTLSRQLLINVTATRQGNHEPRRIELAVEDSVNAAVELPAQQIITPVFEFSAQLLGVNREPVKPEVPLVLQSGERRSFYVLFKWDEKAVNKRVVHPFGAPIDYTLASIASSSPIGEWQLDDKKSREFMLNVDARAPGRSPTHRLEFSVDKLIAQIHIPQLVVFAPTFTIMSAPDASGLLLRPGVPEQTKFILSDNTEPLMPESFWGLGGAAESSMVTVSSPDESFKFLFENNQDKVRLSEFKPGIQVPLTVSFVGSQHLFGMRSMTVTPEFNLRSATAAPASGSDLKSRLTSGSKLEINVPPMIHPGLIAVVVLLLIVAGVFLVMTTSKKRALAEEAKKRADDIKRREREEADARTAELHAAGIFEAPPSAPGVPAAGVSPAPATTDSPPDDPVQTHDLEDKY